MIWGNVINGKIYAFVDYLVALGVMCVSTIFAMCDGRMENVAEKLYTNFYGISLMIIYLCFDGFTTTFQEKLFKQNQIQTINQVFWVNFCSVVISSFWLFSDFSMGKAIKFVSNHQESFVDILFLSLASTCGQLCILYTIREFGALLLATIMTTRQILSISLSSIIFMHPLSELQSVGSVLVFLSLYYHITVKYIRKNEAKDRNRVLPTHALKDEANRLSVSRTRATR